jgi:hypothetical protein
MSKHLTSRGKFILIVISLVIFAVCLYILKLGNEYVFFFFLLTPLFIISLGKMAELLINVLERVSTGPLSIIKLGNFLFLLVYYVLFSIFLAVLIENSIVLSLLNFRFTEWQVAIISLGLAFLPRVLSYASSMERARGILLAILTPLTLTATVVLFIRPASVIFNLKTLEFCVVGSILQTALGDLSLYFAGFMGLINPTITIETIPLLDLRRLVHSQLETIQWDNICHILNEAKRLSRVDIVQKIMESMNFFVDESRRRRAKLARVVFVDALIKTIFSHPNLKQDLVPFLKSLQVDQEAEVRARVAPCCIVLSKEMPSKGVKSISEWLNDDDITVLEEIGRTIAGLLKSDPDAPLYATKLSLNPVFIRWLEEHSDLEHIAHARAREVTSMIDRPNPIIQALKAAYMISPDTVSRHIDSCSLNKDPKLRILAATVVSDPDFAKDDRIISQVRERLKKDKNPKVIMRVMSYIGWHDLLERFGDKKETNQVDS